MNRTSKHLLVQGDRESKRTDQHGNQFRYRANKNAQGQQMGRWAWDVFLVKAQ